MQGVGVLGVGQVGVVLGDLLKDLIRRVAGDADSQEGGETQCKGWLFWNHSHGS